MLEIAFQYSYAKKDWIKCTNPDYITKDIEKLPIVPLIRARMNEYGFRLYCRKHNRLEGVREINDGKVFSCDECATEGLLGIESENSLVPVRWRIFQRDVYSSINIAADVLDMDCLYRRKYHSYLRDSHNELKEWTKVLNIDIPYGVVDAAINAMGESIKTA